MVVVVVVKNDTGGPNMGLVRKDDDNARPASREKICRSMLFFSERERGKEGLNMGKNGWCFPLGVWNDILPSSPSL